MPNCYQDLKSIAKEVATVVAKDFETALTKGLNELIESGFVEIQYEEPVLTHDESTNEFHFFPTVRFLSKHQEYMTKIEKENEKLKERLNVVKQMFPGFDTGLK